MFSRILYYLVLLPLSWLPMAVLYGISDLLAFLLIYIIPYRKKVIEDNLRHAFPNYSDDQIKTIRNKFYRHFSDLAVETIRTLSMSSDELNRRMKVTNPDILESAEYKGKHLLLLTAHFGNWEWAALQLATHTPSRDVYGIYLPLNNKFFDEKIRTTRNRFGTRLISTRDLPKFIESASTKPSAFAFIADQNPSNLNKTTWVNFFGREVPVAKGPERYASKLSAPVIYGNIQKIARGQYEVTYEMLSPDGSQMKEGLLLVQFMNRVEQIISYQPEYWLWSHKRWKHKKKSS